MDALALGIFLAGVLNRLIEYFLVPLFERFNLDKFYLLYLSALGGMVLMSLSGIRLILPVGPDIGYWPDILLSGVIISGGANLIADIFDGDA